MPCPGPEVLNITGLPCALDTVFYRLCTPQIITMGTGKAVPVPVQKRTLSSGPFPTPCSYVQENKTNKTQQEVLEGWTAFVRDLVLLDYL